VLTVLVWSTTLASDIPKLLSYDSIRPSMWHILRQVLGHNSRRNSKYYLRYSLRYSLEVLKFDFVCTELRSSFENLDREDRAAV